MKKTLLFALLAVLLGGALCLVLLNQRAQPLPQATAITIIQERSEPTVPAPPWPPAETGKSRAERPMPLRLLRVLVTGDTGDPLPRATVALLDVDGAMLEFAQTNGDGVADLDASLASSTEVIASKPGYARTTRRLGVEETPRVTLALDRAGAIRGRVRLPSGEAPHSPITVFAHPMRDPLPGSAKAMVHPRNRLVQTSATGEFVFEDTRIDELHRIYAGGSGYIAKDRSGLKAAAGGPDVEIIVAPVYALAVRLNLPAGHVLSTRLHTESGVGTSTDINDMPGIQKVMAVPSAWLAGIPRAEAEHVNNEIVHIYTADHEPDTLGPVSVSASCAGAMPFRADLFALRVRESVLPWQVVELTPTFDGVGAVALDMGAVAARMRASDNSSGTGGALAIHFKKIGTTESKDELVVYQYRSSSGDLLEPFPVGNYEVRATWFRRHGPAVRCVPDRVSIAAGQRTTIGLELAPFGAVTLMPTLGSKKEPYSGSLYVFATSAARSQSGTHFDGPPYQLDWLEPGECTIAANPPMKNNSEQVYEPVKCLVTAGERTQVAVHWASK